MAIGGMFGVIIALAFWALGLVVMYVIIRTAVRDGVREAQQELVESMRAIERKITGGTL